MEMVALRPAEMSMIDDIFEMREGYALNFSNATMAEFFDAELGVDIYQDKYAFNGTSKAKRIRAFIEAEDAYTVGALLRKLWDHRASYGDRSESEEARDKERLFDLITRIETGQAPQALSRLSGTADVLNFDTVSPDLKRSLESAHRDPESAVTSACSTVESVCRSILIELSEGLPAKKDIKGLFNAVKNLSASHQIAPTLTRRLPTTSAKSLAGWLPWSRASAPCAPTVATPTAANAATPAWIPASPASLSTRPTPSPCS
jgi:hypothetical protein